MQPTLQAQQLHRCLPTLVLALHRGGSSLCYTNYILAQGVQHSRPCESCCLHKIPWEEKCQKDAGCDIFVLPCMCVWEKERAQSLQISPVGGLRCRLDVKHKDETTHTHTDKAHTHTYMYETTTKVASVCECIVRLSYAEDGLKDYIFIIFLSLFFAWLRSTEGKNAKIQYLNAFKSKPTLSVSLYLHRGNSLPRVTDFRFPLSLMQHLYRIVCLASIW